MLHLVWNVLFLGCTWSFSPHWTCKPADVCHPFGTLFSAFKKTKLNLPDVIFLCFAVVKRDDWKLSAVREEDDTAIVHHLMPLCVCHSFMPLSDTVVTHPSVFLFVTSVCLFLDDTTLELFFALSTKKALVATRWPHFSLCMDTFL